MKRTRCISPSRHPNIQRNLETFRETFQKGSQIYRFLKESWKTHPLYLNRTLNYISKYRDPRKRLKTSSRSKQERLESLIARLKGERCVEGNNQIEVSTTRNSDRRSIIVENTSYQSVNNKQTKDKKENVCYFDWICDDLQRTSQKTRSLGYICPWFNFELVPNELREQVVIQMTLNKEFDGSYCGFKYPGHDLKSDFKFTPELPRRRTPLTQIIHFRTKHRNHGFNLTSIGDLFSYEDGEADVDVCSGRLYYHTSTCLPIKPNEVDIDSEADMDPDWLRERTQLMIDEFTDVNEGEKEILKLWNLHIMTNFKYKGDNTMPQACLDFVESEGPTILSKNLRKNFTLHLANLYDFGLIGSEDILDCTRKLNKTKPSPTTTPSVTSSPSKLSGKTRLDRNSNEHCQNSSPAKRALLNSHCNQ